MGGSIAALCRAPQAATSLILSSRTNGLTIILIVRNIVFLASIITAFNFDCENNYELVALWL